MSTADELARRIQVVHRAAGYLRLELPAELCGPAAATAIENGLLALPGVSQATVDRPWQRLSVRHDAALCTAPQIARHLFGLLADLPLEAPAAAASAESTESAPAAATPFGLQPLLDRLQQLLGLAEPAPDGSLQARLQPVLASALTEKAIYNFLNDLVAFYLVKTHWELISKRWIKTPLAYSNAWMTVFYLVFLLVRYRKSNAGK